MKDSKPNAESDGWLEEGIFPMGSKFSNSVFASILLLGFVAGPVSANDGAFSNANLQPRQESLQNAPSFPTAGSTPHTTVYEGAKWTSNSAITWSIATGPGTEEAPFSAYLGAEYQPLAKQAFATWAAASGLSFQQVPDSAAVDIRLGWGKFNTISSGIVGHTVCHALAGEMLPNGIIRLEDPAEHTLLAASGDAPIYSGTTANLYQVMLHEIGHALGLADNTDVNSIMYFEATGMNNVLTGSDVAGIRELYAPAARSIPTLQAAVSDVTAPAMNPQAKVMNQAASFEANQTARSASAPSLGRAARSGETSGRVNRAGSRRPGRK